MVMCVRDATDNERRRRIGQGGPVFLPRRKLSPIARAILSSPAEGGERITAYDEIWYAGRGPSVPSSY